MKHARKKKVDDRNKIDLGKNETCFEWRNIDD